MHGNKLILIMLTMLLIVNIAYAQAGLSEESSKTSGMLEDAKLDMAEAIEAGFSVRKINDTLVAAKQLFDAQIALEKQGGASDYRTIKDMVNEIRDTTERAFETADEISALNSYLGSIRGELDTSAADEIYQNAKGEFDRERYDQATELVEDAYKVVSQIQSESTTAFAIYRAATETLTDFLKKNWHIIVATLSIIVVVLIVTQNRVYIYTTTRRINKLDFEKKILENLIKKTQNEYFEKKTLPEETYRIRIKKFEEIIRDINRQIPLLKENIETRKSGKKQGKKRDKISLMEPEKVEEHIKSAMEKYEKKPEKRFSIFRRKPEKHRIKTKDTDKIEKKTGERIKDVMKKRKARQKLSKVKEKGKIKPIKKKNKKQRKQEKARSKTKPAKKKKAINKKKRNSKISGKR